MKMNRLLFALITAVTVFCSHALADDYWPRTYFVEAGFGAAYSRGDLNKHIIKTADTLGNKVTVHPPTLNFLASPDLTLGANIWAFTLTANFQYWKSTQELTKYDEEDNERNSRIWRFGFEFTYNLLWPEDFQIGLGGGYSYSNIKTKNSAMFGYDESSAELMGSGLAFIANFRYYFTNHIAVVPSVKIYENWYKNIYTEQTGLCDLDHYFWQTTFFASLSVQYQF